METIPSVYWMIIIGIVVAFICLVLYQFAMLLKESKDTVKETRDILAEAQKAIESANEILTTVKGTVTEVNNAIIGPIRKISSVLGVVGSFVEGMKSRK